MAHDAAEHDPAPEEWAPAEAAPAGPGRITRVILKNYKSIVSCDVELQPLTILVGPNGSGKSNFLDALAFVSEALTVGLAHAIRNRGNIERILSAARPAGEDSFSIELHFQLPSGHPGRYEFDVKALGDNQFAIQWERLYLFDAKLLRPELFSIDQEREDAQFSVEGGQFSGALADFRNIPLPTRDRLYLSVYSAERLSRPIYDLLTSMVIYNPLPDVMRSPVEQSAEPHLLSDGRNLASVLRRMETSDADLNWRITQYLTRVLSSLDTIKATSVQGFDFLSFLLETGVIGSTREFTASQMSDGTLRALAILVALFQHRIGGKSATSLVGIEEPENNLHPATGGAFADALLDASYDGQVLVTTHSTSLLDGDEIDVSSLLAVSAENGVTRIGPVDKVSRDLIAEHLYTAGELLQQDQMHPETEPDRQPPSPSTSDPLPVGR